MRYFFLKITVVLVELAGIVALLAGIALALFAVRAWGPGGDVHGAKLLLPDGRSLSLGDVPLLRFMTLAPGVGTALMGILMLGVGQLCEVVLRIDRVVHKGGPGEE